MSSFFTSSIRASFYHAKNPRGFKRLQWSQDLSLCTLESFRNFRFLSSSTSSNAISKSQRKQEAKKARDDDLLAEKIHQSTVTKSMTASSLLRAYWDLSKGRLSALVVTTTAVGYLSAGGGPLEVMGWTCLGTALCSSSAAALNQIWERDRDALMKRTQQRPLVQNVLSPTHATAMATVWGISGTSLLYFGTGDMTTAMLGLTNIGLYSGLYTFLKRHTIYNTWVGAVVGAIPPVMGWSAATGGHILDIECLLLGTTLYLWQMPHFFALSYMHRTDYARGGFHMVSVLELDGSHTAQLITRYALYLSAIPFVSTFTGITSSMFALEGIALNGYALWVAHDFSKHKTNAKARKVFLTSLWYLPCLLTLFLIHSKTWDEKQTEDNIIRRYIDSILHSVRDQGRKLCIHEVIATDQETSSINSACPFIAIQQKETGNNPIAAVSILKNDSTESAK
jgi:heme o synthase